MTVIKKDLIHKNSAFLAEDHDEDLELWRPLLRMQAAGARVVVAGMPDLPASCQISLEALHETVTASSSGKGR